MRLSRCFGESSLLLGAVIITSKADTSIQSIVVIHAIVADDLHVLLADAWPRRGATWPQWRVAPTLNGERTDVVFGCPGGWAPLSRSNPAGKLRLGYGCQRI